MKPLPLLAAGMTLALAACSSQGSDPAASGSPDPELMTPEATMAASAAPSPSAAAPAKVAEIPTGLQGRWGLVPADCTSTRGDAKGLLTVGARELRFYESVAKLGSATSSGERDLQGGFAYSGEGMTWNRDVTLTELDGGKRLELSDTGPDSPPSRLVYTRCG